MTIQEIKTAVKDLEEALLADLEAKEKEVQIAQERKKTHYQVLKARERLSSLD